MSSPSSSKGKKSRPSHSKHAYIEKRVFKGGRYTPPTNPPPTRQNPWNTIVLVVQKKDTKTIVFKASDIILNLQLMLGGKDVFNGVTESTTNTLFDIRVQSVAVWNISGKSIALVAHDYMMEVSRNGTFSQTEVLDDIVDARTDGNVPAVGYRWPLSHQSHVLTNDSDKPRYVFQLLAPENSQLYIHIHLLWRPSTTKPYTPVTYATTLDRISFQSTRTRRIMEEQIKLLKDRLQPTKLGGLPVFVMDPIPLDATTSEQDDDHVELNASDEDEETLQQMRIKEVLNLYNDITQLVHKIKLKSDPPDQPQSEDSGDMCSDI